MHLHQLFIDGTYELGPQNQPIDFWAGGKPEVSEIAKILRVIIDKLIRYLEKQGIISKDQEQEFQLPISDEDVFAKLQTSSITYRFATGKSKGKKAIVLKVVDDGDHSAPSGLVAEQSGFSLHAGVATTALERDKLERICRYIARPAVAEDRLSLSDNGDVIYKFKKPWSDGTSAIKLTPLELMEKLAALVPRPRVHLTRFHGVLGPNYKYRNEIVPKPKEQLPQVPTDKNKKPSKQRIPWARLLARVFKIDVETCPHCQGRVKIIAAIEDPAVIVKILEHLGLPTRAPRVHSARGPPRTNENADFDMSQFPSIDAYFDPIFQD